MEPVDGFNPTAGPARAPRRRPGDAAPDGRGDGRRHRRAVARRPGRGRGRRSASSTAGSNGRSPRWRAQLDGYAKFEGLERARRAARGRRDLRLARGEPARRRCSRGSSTATITSPTSCSARTRPNWPRSSTGNWRRRGDPLLDLGWLTATWRDPDEGGPARVGRRRGRASRRSAEIVERYLAATGRTRRGRALVCRPRPVQARRDPRRAATRAPAPG